MTPSIPTVFSGNTANTCNCPRGKGRKRKPNCSPHDTYNTSEHVVQRVYIGNSAKRGTPVFFSSGNALESSTGPNGVPIVSGFIVGAANYGEPVDVQVDGVIVATEVEWASVVTENTVLQESVAYYLSDTPGQITSCGPSTQGSVSLPIGLALSSTELAIRIGQPIKL